MFLVFCTFVQWLTNNNEKNEKKNLKRCKGYDKRRTDVQRGTAAEGNG
jgi:hypothetical protein